MKNGPKQKFLSFNFHKKVHYTKTNGNSLLKIYYRVEAFVRYRNISQKMTNLTSFSLVMINRLVVALLIFDYNHSSLPTIPNKHTESTD